MFCSYISDDFYITANSLFFIRLLLVLLLLLLFLVYNIYDWKIKNFLRFINEIKIAAATGSAIDICAKWGDQMTIYLFIFTFFYSDLARYVKVIDTRPLFS